VRDLALRFWPNCSRRLEYSRRYTETFIDLVLEMYASSIFLDSSKDPVRIKYLASIPCVQLQVVHLIRDGRGVVNSTRKNLGWPAREASIDWRKTQLEIERVTKRFAKGSVLRIKYEDICRNPDRMLASIFAFVGITGPITATKAAEREMHVLGNRMRLNGVLPIRLDESWRREMSDGDLATFASIAGNLNASYGYGVDRDET
jgi:hypothetical protein